MNSNITRVVVGIVVVVAAVVLFVVLKDDGRSDYEKLEDEGKIEKIGKSADVKASPAVTTIVIKDGKPVGGIADLTYNKGERVRFKVDSDVSDEVHMHGYDIMKDVEAGGTVAFDFPATIEGIFEAELEGRGEQILELTVNP
jgi:major membrane immunogen (membrane-anchored lipoprotein)